MKTYKNFNIFKREPKEGEEVNPNAPGYDITASEKNPDGTYGKSVNIGAIWLKEAKTGKKYFSAQLSKPIGDKAGYVIVQEDELKKVLELAEAMVQKTKSPLKDGYPTEVERGVPTVSNYDFDNPDDIPF